MMMISPCCRDDLEASKKFARDGLPWATECFCPPTILLHINELQHTNYSWSVASPHSCSDVTLQCGHRRTYKPPH